ncbi:MAG TPA: HlyD family efflux transporter periplasmic adaptor subunit [Xanthobacteraceae bacterium]
MTARGRCTPDRQGRASLSKSWPGILIAAGAWLGSTGLGFAQPAEGAMGRVEGGEVLSLGTSATGTIAEMPVSAGDRVKAGQRLVQIECSAVEREVEARKSDLAAAEAAYLRIQHGPRPEEISVGIANVNLADARLHEAQRAYERVQSLREGVTVTRVQIDQAERDAHMAAAMLEENRAKLHLLQAGSREEDIAEARARRDAAKARVDEAAARLSYCAVVAPIDGIVLSTHVSPGQLVSTMAPVTLLTMIDDSRRRVRAFVDEREISKVCPGEHARIAADGVPGMQFDGVVESVGAVVVDNPLVNNASRQFRQVMLAVAANPEPTIGLRVSVQFLPCTASQRGPR